MKRDMELIRKILLEIEKDDKGIGFYQITSMNGYSYDELYLHLCLMDDAGFFNKVQKDLSGGFMYDRLTNRGYDFLETIRNDEVWEETKKEVEKKKLPKTIETIVGVAGYFIGKVMKGYLGGADGK